MENSRIVELLGERAQPLFAILDAARVTDPQIRFASEGVEICSLYGGTTADELQEVAPYLVAIGDNLELLEKLVGQGWGRSWGVYLSSPLPCEELRRHLRKFLKVRTEDGEELYFRFYDQRVPRV